MRVHGVVVHARKYASSCFNLNFTKMDGSSTVLYPCASSCADSTVPQRGQYGTTLCPLYSSFFSQACFRDHQTDSMYSFLNVIYGLSMSSQKAIRRVMSTHARSYLS